MEVRGFLIFLVGEGKGGFFFLSCIWCGKWTIHCSLSTWIVDFPCKCFFLGFDLFCFGGEGGRASKQKVSKFLTCSLKSSK